MADHSKLAGRFWPTSQQLVVVCGEPALVAQWFDAVRDHHEAARDVIDLWDEEGLYLEPRWLDHMADAMERMRHTLFLVRQWDVES